MSQLLNVPSPGASIKKRHGPPASARGGGALTVERGERTQVGVFPLPEPQTVRDQFRQGPTLGLVDDEHGAMRPMSETSGWRQRFEEHGWRLTAIAHR